jgi:hypothetical protein
MVIAASAHELSRDILDRYQTKRPAERLAIAFTLVGAALGVAFACLAPLSVESRVGRLMVDALVLLGVISYLHSPETEPAPKRRPILSTVARVLFAVFTVAAIVFTATVPGLDPWIRAYKLSLSVIVLAVTISDMPRAISANFGRKLALLYVATVAIEAVVFLFMTWSVDGPILYAGVSTGINRTTSDLLGDGIQMPNIVHATANAQSPNLIVYQRGRMRGTSDLYDVVHWARGDIAKTFRAYLTAAHQQGPIHMVRSLTQTSAVDSCRALRLIDPPLTGYKRFENMAVANETAMKCAVTLDDRPWQRRIYHTVFAWVAAEKIILKSEVGNHRCIERETADRRIETFYDILDAYSTRHGTERAYWNQIAAEIDGSPEQHNILSFLIKSHHALPRCHVFAK